ncbi:NAD(P)-dependent oxidoreductase [Mycobacterium stomatepiae]|uniref:Uncharacterized protein n=1 Tax=Mycobacterium stomatepiae TaxID=470076 RepID=A0A7I7QH52_9MYCO|nr:NAD(P)-dependent oxidoreductase [Mycobacterium stomatepiae]MCV7166155.1 NAD(P)-dependent oxidoreductase [Mycobacterium stomatepiae]BBY25664.1 hypothetical protein MSTO_58690 [Mycobacterium stomatepiae]
MAERIGLDPQQVWRLVTSEGTIADQLELRGALIASRMYGPSSATVSDCITELRQITELAQSVQSPTPLLDMAAVLYDVAASMGYGHHDSSAVHASYVQLPHP